MPTAVVVQHVPHEGPGWLAEILDEAGVAVDIRRMYDGASLPSSDGFDALIVLGGPMGADDDERVPWLGPVKSLLADAVQRGAPTLGICLGAQLLAVSCGSTVEKGAEGPELGLGPLQMTDAAGSDVLFAGVDLDPQ